MTTDDLDRLEALCAAATAGPWFERGSSPGDGGAGPHDRVVTGGYFVEVDDEDGNEYPCCVVVAHVKGNVTAGGIPQANAAIIAAARTAVPALLAELKTARQENDALAARVRELEALLPPAIPDFYTCGCASAPKGDLHAFCPRHKKPLRATRPKETP